MQTSAAKEDQPDSTTRPRNWRHRKVENARRRHEKQRRRELIDGYVARLGGADRISQIQMTEVMRVVDMTLLAEGMRAKALRGEAIDIGDMGRLEGAVSRVIRSLNLPSPNPAGPMGLHDIVARHAAGRRADLDEAD